MSDIMKKRKGHELPDELLEAVSGGAYSPDNLEERKELIRTRLAGLSEEELEKLRVTITGFWNKMSDKDKAAVYADEYALFIYETYMGQSLR